MKLPRKALLNYALLAFPLAFVGMPLYIHAPDFYATQYGMSLSTLAAILLSLRIVDAVQDPVIGQLSDRYPHCRQRIMLFSLLALVAGFFALFNPLIEATALWFGISLFVATTAFSVLTINLGAIGALWSSDERQQARITTAREGVAMLGLVLAVVLPTVLSQKMSLTQAFQSIGFLLAIFAIIAFWRFTIWYRNHQSMAETSLEELSVLAAVKKLFRELNHATRHFFLTYAVSMIASAMPAVLVLFFIRDRLDAEDQAGYFLLVYFLSGVIGMPLWKALSHRFCPTRAWFVTMLLSILSFAGAFFLGAGDIIGYYVICFVSGFALGGDMALPPAILALHMHENKSQNAASSQFSILAFISKSSLAIAGLVTLPALELAGFVPAQENSAEALMALSVAYALLPVCIKSIAAMLLWRHINHYKPAPIKEEPNDENTNHSPADRSLSHA
jgi:Na+/melibiose symporter-like transporter